jgi:flagellar motor switch protein FliN/FliY
MDAADKDQEKLDANAFDGEAGTQNPTTEPQQKAPVNSNPNEASDVNSCANMDFILDIPLQISVELGRTKMLINELLKLGQGSVIELSKLAGETLEILANQKLVARGEVVVVNEKYGVRLTEIISPIERIERLK